MIANIQIFVILILNESFQFPAWQFTNSHPANGAQSFYMVSMSVRKFSLRIQSNLDIFVVSE